MVGLFYVAVQTWEHLYLTYILTSALPRSADASELLRDYAASLLLCTCYTRPRYGANKNVPAAHVPLSRRALRGFQKCTWPTFVGRASNVSFKYSVRAEYFVKGKSRTFAPRKEEETESFGFGALLIKGKNSS